MNAGGLVFVIAGLIIVDVIILAIAFFVLRNILKGNNEKELKLRSDNVIKDAREQAQGIELDARNKALKEMKELDEETSRRRGEMNKEEERIQKRRSDLDFKIERLEQRESNLNKRQSTIDKRANEIEKQYEKQLEELQRISEMTREEAKQELLQNVERDSRNDMARIIRQIEYEARQEGEKRARSIITESIQRIASDHVAEVTTSVVPLPNEEMKGRIVGRNGRNIRAFEQEAGVDVIVDDTPESVTISCFDPVRREIARRSLERLILDGRIHPAYIEKVLAEEGKAVEKVIMEAGEQAAFDAGVPGLHPEVMRMMGRLKFRTSYGQNQLAHAVETAKIAAIIASELGGNVDVARTGAFLHDIGKAMDHNSEGTHASLGAEFIKRHGVNQAVVNVVASHHHEVDQQSVEAVIAEAADAISGARPGARREDLEQYIKRLRALEDIANAHKGVSQSYAIQAGREIRIIVRPEDVDDLAAIQMSHDISKQIEENMQYPGQIKVTVIRETRAIDFAK